MRDDIDMCSLHFAPKPCAHCALVEDLKELQVGRGIRIETEKGPVIIHDEKERRTVLSRFTDTEGRELHLTSLPGNPDLVGRMLALETTVANLLLQVTMPQAKVKK